MHDYVERGEVKQVITQLKDGSTWTAEIGLDGKLRLLEQLSDPTKVTASKPEAGDEVEPDESEEDSEESSEESEDGEASEEADESEWGEAEEVGKGYSDKEMQDFLDSLDHRELKEKSKGELDQYAKMYEVEPPKNMMKNTKDNAFAARLRSIMLDNKYDRRVRGRTRGKLDMNRLYKVPTGSRNVFLQKESRKGKNYNVVLLVDESGSMSGRKAQLAESAVFLTKHLTDLGINVGVIGFRQFVKVHKDLVSKPDYDFIYKSIAAAGGDNADYDAMRRAYKMFEKAPAGKNIFIMLSDGAPVGYHHAITYDINGKEENILPRMPSGIDYDTREHFHHLVNSHKDVESIGIGIQAGGWQVPDHEVIQDVGELKKTIIKQLRKHITRG